MPASSQQPWRKSRTFGGRKSRGYQRKMTDNIFARLHSLTPPGPHDPVPLLLQDNPSRALVHPASAEDVLAQLATFPRADTEHLTHVWLRRRRVDQQTPLGEFICGSGVRLIVLYAWNADLIWRFGTRRPSEARLRSLESWSTDLRHHDNAWNLHWTEESARGYVLDTLLPHEVAHLRD